MGPWTETNDDNMTWAEGCTESALLHLRSKLILLLKIIIAASPTNLEWPDATSVCQKVIVDQPNQLWGRAQLSLSQTPLLFSLARSSQHPLLATGLQLAWSWDKVLASGMCMEVMPATPSLSLRNLLGTVSPAGSFPSATGSRATCILGSNVDDGRSRRRITWSRASRWAGTLALFGLYEQAQNELKHVMEQSWER